jgi:hypothetical protein
MNLKVVVISILTSITTAQVTNLEEISDLWIPPVTEIVTLTTTNFVTLTATSLATLTITKTDKCITTDQSVSTNILPQPGPQTTTDLTTDVSATSGDWSATTDISSDGPFTTETSEWPSDTQTDFTTDVSATSIDGPATTDVSFTSADGPVITDIFTGSSTLTVGDFTVTFSSADRIIPAYLSFLLAICVL